MPPWNYQDGLLHLEQVPLSHIAGQFGTPCYVYSRSAIMERWHTFDAAFADRAHLICYAVKANSNLAVLQTLARLGSGFDIVSKGELERVLLAGGDPAKIVFSGVGKREDEIRRALEVGIRCFNVEVGDELRRIDHLAGAMGVAAPVALRINPDIDSRTHPYISTGLRENKFGIDLETAFALYRRAADLPRLRVAGIACHIGSQLIDTAPFLEALERVLELAERLMQEGIGIRHLDLGGGLGIRYRDEAAPEPAAYVKQLLERLGDSRLEICLEPGRAIVGNAGLLLTRVEYLKPHRDKRFAIVDAAMNDLIRPALYQAWQEILPVAARTDVPQLDYDVVGPVCETGDFLGLGRPLRIAPGDLLAVASAGAYGFVMSSNYNTRPRPAEVMVEGREIRLVRERESLDDLLRGERGWE